MKRSAALAPLSRDHQHSLAAAFALRRAEPATLEAAIAGFERFFESEGRHHFAIEERLLTPELLPGDAEWQAGITRMLAEHERVRAQADLTGIDEPGERLTAARALGELLDRHVRFEDRELFVALEQRLPAPELDRLGAAVAAAEAQLSD